MKTNIKINKRGLSYEGAEEIIFDKNTIILNETTKNQIEHIKETEEKLKQARAERIKRNKTSEVMEIIETLFIGFLIVSLMVMVWLVGIRETNALEVKIIPFKPTYEFTSPADLVNEQAFQLIIQFEGYHDKPYWDYKQWSCGYGMKCSQFTTGITKEKSKKFVIGRIEHIKTKHNLEQYESGLQVALISFIYNIGHPPIGLERFVANNYTNALKNTMREYSYAGGEYMRGLAKRRNVETELF